MDLYDQIYFSLAGELEPPLDWVPDAFAPGSVCADAYSRMLDARDRVLARLGLPEDPDLEQMLQEMETIQRRLCREALALYRHRTI